MNKKIILVILVLLIGLFGFLGVKSLKKSNPQTNNNQQTQNNTSGNNTTGTLKSLLTAGKSVKCSFSNNVKETAVNGTVYVADGKMRGDFKSIAGGTTVSGHTIVDSSYSYFWTDTGNQGFKFPVPSGTTSTNPAMAKDAPDINQPFNFSCQDWTKDDSVFTLPSNITFQTFTIPSIPALSGMPKIPTGGLINKDDKCAICARILEAPQKNACKTQFNCK